MSKCKLPTSGDLHSEKGQELPVSVNTYLVVVYGVGNT